MKARFLSLLPLVVCSVISPVWPQSRFTVAIPEGIPNPGRLFIVKHTGDSVDANPGDGACADASGQCMLRAAIDETNANQAPADVVVFELAYPAVIELTEGSLDLTESSTSIIGPGARRLTIRRRPSAKPFRIFNVTSTNGFGRTVIRGLRLEGG